MPLITCPECDTMVSRSAKSCPTCGASARAIARGQQGLRQQHVGRRGKILIGGVVAAIVAAAGISIVSTPSSAPQSDPKADTLDKARRDATITDVASLKGALRDPDSLVFEKILVNEDGSVVCIRYRARNGFGGTNREQAVFADRSGTTSPVAWNKRCAHAALYDETTDTLTMMKMLRR